MQIEPGRPNTLWRHVCAAPYSVTGWIKWGPLLPAADLCEAQQAIRGARRNAHTPARSRGRIVLELVAGQPGHKESSHYYSAYIWVMFAIVDRAGKPFFARGWRNLLPFFEHGNIADASTYFELKRLLAVKVCTALADILKRDPAVYLRLACAYDQSLCSHPHGAMYPPPPGELISDLLRSQITSSAAFADPAFSARLVLPTEAEIDNGHEYTACDLPERIEEYFDDLAAAHQARTA